MRRYSSDDPPEPPVEGRNIPDYWIRPPQRLSAEAGLHRFVWDLRHETAGGVVLRLPDRGHLPEHAARAARAVGGPGHVHGPAHRGRARR